MFLMMPLRERFQQIVRLLLATMGICGLNYGWMKVLFEIAFRFIVDDKSKEPKDILIGFDETSSEIYLQL